MKVLDIVTAEATANGLPIRYLRLGEVLKFVSDILLKESNDQFEAVVDFVYSDTFKKWLKENLNSEVESVEPGLSELYYNWKKEAVLNSLTTN